MSKKIFLSHAHADIALVERFVDFLKLGLDISRQDIYCSSLGTVPTGQNFIENIQQNVSGCKLVILLITESFLQSKFCLCEVGAAWALGLEIVWIVLLFGV